MRATNRHPLGSGSLGFQGTARLLDPNKREEPLGQYCFPGARVQLAGKRGLKMLVGTSSRVLA